MRIQAPSVQKHICLIIPARLSLYLAGCWAFITERDLDRLISFSLESRTGPVPFFALSLVLSVALWNLPHPCWSSVLFCSVLLEMANVCHTHKDSHSFQPHFQAYRRNIVTAGGRPCAGYFSNRLPGVSTLRRHTCCFQSVVAAPFLPSEPSLSQCCIFALT